MEEPAQPLPRRRLRQRRVQGLIRPRLNYFQGDAGAQRRYWGIKAQTQFRRQFPLQDYTYYPLRRGSEQSLAMYGASHREANPDQRLNRANYLMTGRGLYKGRGGYWGRAIGNLFGMGDLGDKLGDIGSNVISAVVPGGKQAMDLVSSDVGQGLGKLASSVTGSGMYKRGRGLYRGKGLYKGRGEYVATNGLISGENEVVPQFAQNDLKSTTITNREFIADIYAPSATAPFSVQEYPLNPGMPKLWKWLSQIAINYEEYEIKQCIVTYKSTVADFAASSGQVGQIIMATQYNPSADTFASKEEMMLYEGGMSCKTTQSMQHGIECDPSKITGSPVKYVRVGALPAIEDIKEYDLGKLAMAIVGIPSTYANQQIGELWVSYTVELRRPKLGSIHAYNVPRDLFVMQNLTSTTNQTPPNPSNWLRASRNSGICTITNPGSSTAIKSAADHLNYGVYYPIGSVGGHTTAPTLATLTFADGYTGIVRIVFRYMSTQAITNNLYIASSDEPQTAGWVQSIFRFTDIPLRYQVDQANRWTHVKMNVENSDSFHEGSFGDCYREAELHLRILPPRNGQKNQIYFAQNHGAAVTQFALSVEVTQYNTFLSTSDTGSNDRITFVNQITLQETAWT